MQEIINQMQAAWAEYWPIIYDLLAQPPPILWIIGGVATLLILIPMRRGKMNRKEHVHRVVTDEALKMLENLAETGRITWAEAEAEMLRMGRNFHWGDLIPKRLQEYTLSKGDQQYLKGTIRSRMARRKANGQSRPVNIPGDKPPDIVKKKLSSGRIGQLIIKHRL